MNNATDIVAGIRESLSKAYKESQYWDSRGAEGDEEELVNYFVERAFMQTLLFLEAAGLPNMAAALASIQQEAKKNYSASAAYSEGLYLIWANKLDAFIEAIETAFGKSKEGRVTKELVEVLRSTLYSITDRRCFPAPPQNEADVHSRIEAVLRCVFPDLRHKPPIGKPIKNFEPDTGIPSLKTLIEYKYVDSADRVKTVADEVLADTRAYASKEWERFIYVIYETARWKAETEWKQLLLESGVGANTDILVLCGETQTAPFAPKASGQNSKTSSKANQV